METTQKKSSPISFIVIALVILVIAYGLMKLAPVKAPTIEDEDMNQISQSSCGLTVVSPTPNSLVSFPLTVNAIVDNTNMEGLGCAWTVFEAQAGTVKVMDANNTQVGIGFISTTSDWMTTSPVNYTGTINLTGTPVSNALTLVFEEDNPSGEGVVDSFTVPVTKQ